MWQRRSALDAAVEFSFLVLVSCDVRKPYKVVKMSNTLTHVQGNLLFLALLVADALSFIFFVLFMITAVI